jgi:type I restriction enzyme M protein
MVRRRTTEHDAYHFIEDSLKSLGWNTRCPPDGDVYTQNECLNHPEIQRAFVQRHPENIIKITETDYWVIEAKRDISQLQLAVNEARGRVVRINNSSNLIKGKIISGVAGNKNDGFLIKNEYFDGTDFVPITINQKETSGLLKPEEAYRIISEDDPNLEDVIIDEKQFLDAAERINDTLHNGAINKNVRAKVMASILLSMVDVTQPNINATPIGLIRDINSRALNVLETQGKSEFAEQIKIQPPPSSDNHVKYKKALVNTIQELNLLQIRSAMNSGVDVLGKFYEVFLKYGNGAKEIGIVLTPRHITKFAVEVLDVDINDIVFDPTCGTGGFLVSAFDYVKSNANEEQIDRFKVNNLFGIEQEPEVVALAIVNMIFRGDGKNNIEEGSCFKKSVRGTIKDGVATAEYINAEDAPGSKVVTKVLMNPPFALKSKMEKEYKFVDRALDQMQDGGILFTILPYSCLTKQGGYKTWRDNLLTNNTLLSVITFPYDLFYPIGVNALGIFIQKGVPHSPDANVFWVRGLNDGFLKTKGKRLLNDNAINDYSSIKNILKSFILNTQLPVETIFKKQIVCPINQEDITSELVPEVYLEEDVPTEVEIEVNLEDTLRELISTMIGQNRMNDFLEKVVTENLFNNVNEKSPESFESKSITEFFNMPIETGDYHASNALDKGEIPLISCSTLNGGVEGSFDLEILHNNVITIASDGQPLTSFYHYYDIGVKDNVLIGDPNREYRFTTLLYLVSQLNRLKWRFSYGRKAYNNKVDKIFIDIPISNGEIDEDYIEYLVKKQSSWVILRKLFN